MKVTLVRGGGLAGLVTTVTLDSSSLDDEAAADLRRRVAGCSFTDRPPRPGADRSRAELRVDDGADTSVVRYDEGDPPDGAADLVRWLLDHPAAVRSTGPPG